MFERIKSWIIGIGSALIGVLLMVLGIRKRKIDKLEAENKVQDVIIRDTQTAKDMESKHAEKISEIRSEEAETIEAVRKNEKGYNDIIDSWNNPS